MPIREIRHPLIRHKLGLMRRADISTKNFRELAQEVGALLTYEATSDLTLETYEIEGWCGTVQVEKIAGKKITVVPILRAGIGMSDGLLNLVPSARVGHIGVYRDPATHMPVEYLVRLPDLSERTFILCDPMVATGNSAVYAVDVLKKRGVTDEQIIFLALVAAPEGVTVFQNAHPNVKMFCAALDSHLDDHAYIVPGLGDAGDRIFGTK